MVKDISTRSKRYLKGSIHDIQGGKIRILDRYYDEDGKTILLKYENIDNNSITINKEVNVSASIYKCRKIKEYEGYGDPLPLPKTPHEEEVDKYMNGSDGISKQTAIQLANYSIKLHDILTLLQENSVNTNNIDNNLDSLKDDFSNVKQQLTVSTDVYSTLMVQIKNITDLNNQISSLYKEITKLNETVSSQQEVIKSLTNT